MYRFALSSTRDMHISDLRVAVLNYICAKQSNSKFLVRIEDTDKVRNIDGKDQEILDILAIFGLNYDYLYYQSENFKYHLQFASSLMDKGKAFACFCAQDNFEIEKCQSNCVNISQEELLNNNLPFTIRLKSDDIDDFVIMNQKKYPTRTFSTACDDMLQGVKFIIQDKDNIEDTPRQKLVRASLGFEDEIQYIHLPSILNVNDVGSIKHLLDQGFMPEAITNYLLLLGNETPVEIFSLADTMDWFRVENISKKPIQFDTEKLQYINREHIKLVEDIELSKRIGYSCASIGKLAKLYTQEANTTSQIKVKVDLIFSEKSSEEYQESLDKLKDIVKKAPYFDEFSDFEKYLAKQSDLESEEFLKILQILLTGKQSGPNLSDLYPLIRNYIQEIAR